jgi:quinol monooxygenase YgiN
MSQFAVTARFEVKSGHEKTFMVEMKNQARNSLLLEKGCHYFDVTVSTENAGIVLLYELYSDAAAFDIHLNSDHFLAFIDKVTPMIDGKIIETWEKV